MVPGTAEHQIQRHYDLVVPPPDSFGVYEYLILFFKGCVGLAIVDESHNGRGQTSDIARAMHRVMQASQSHMLTSGTHFGGDIVSFFFYWYRFSPPFWKRLGLSWRQASEAQRRYGVIQLWVKEYESNARKGGGKTDVQVSTVPAPGLSAKLIPYLLESLTFLTVLDVGAFMPPKVEIPEVVSMRDPLVEEKARLVKEIVKVPERALVELAQEKQRLFVAVRDGLASREALQAFSLREEAAQSALREARAESERLQSWVKDHDLQGAYLNVVQSLAQQARQGNQTARMAQGTIPRWFAILPCNKPFELWKTTRTAWGEEIGKTCLLKTPRLSWDYLYPLEKQFIALVQQELTEGRRLMIYIDQNEERSTARRLQWVLEQVNIESWILPNQVKPEDRQQAIIDAMGTRLDGEPAVTVALVPYSRVNEGINLQSVVDTIIWYEMALNLFMLEQASRRAWRLGKREEVRIYYLAYAGTAGHQKMRKLGGQSGAAASFAGEPARGALIEEAGADRTTLARFSATVEAELLPDEEAGEEDSLALLEVDDGEKLKAAFARRAGEERETLQRGRSWLGVIDTLANRLPAFFTGPQPVIWGMRPMPHQVQVIEGDAGSRSRWEPVIPFVTGTTPSIPMSSVAQAESQAETVSPVIDQPTQSDGAFSTQEGDGEGPLTSLVPSSPAKRQEQTALVLIFGNNDHIQLVRQRRKLGKGSTMRASKKPPVQVEVQTIPAVTPQAEEQRKPQPHSPSKKRSASEHHTPTLWDLLTDGSQHEAVAMSGTKDSKSQQRTLW